MYDVWEITVRTDGQVFLRSAGNGLRKEQQIWSAGAHKEFVHEEFRADAPAADNLNAAFNWLHDEGYAIRSFVPAGTSFPGSTFWVLTVRRDINAEKVAAALAATPNRIPGPP